MTNYHYSLLPEIIPFADIKKNFSKQPNELPFLRVWSGYLPEFNQIKYLFTIMKLTGWQAPCLNDQVLTIPDKLHIDATHEFCVFFQKPMSPPNRLFYFQIQSNDKNAKKLGDSLAKAMLNSASEQTRYLTYPDTNQIWSQAARLKLLSLSKLAKLWID